RTTLIASLQQELGGTVEPLRPPHALVAGLPHLAPWECSGYSSRVVVERLGSGEARRWSKDYERFPETEEAFIYSARLRCLLPKLV
ncbi:MAG: hypothetical protein BRC57_09650, partial [Cyanobacteria bacterium QS_8_48_54]